MLFEPRNALVVLGKHDPVADDGAVDERQRAFDGAQARFDPGQALFDGAEACLDLFDFDFQRSHPPIERQDGVGNRPKQLIDHPDIDAVALAHAATASRANAPPISATVSVTP